MEGFTAVPKDCAVFLALLQLVPDWVLWVVCVARCKKSIIFFPRVRTPCGHDAQVIIEGREIQSDGGEKDKDNPTTNQTKPTTAHRPRLHHQVVFPLH